MYFFIMNASSPFDAIGKRSHEENWKHGTPKEAYVYLQKVIWPAMIGNVKYTV